MGSRTRTHFMVAAAMLVACMSMGAVADLAVRSAVTWFARGGLSDDRLQLTVRSGAHAIRLRNLTDESWTSCVVTIDGGYASPPMAIEPRGSAVLPYAIFRSGARPLSDRGGFGRAFRSTLVACADHEQRREVAVLR
jgi:hypothetical protein